METQMRQSTEPKEQRYVKGYRFSSFFKMWTKTQVANVKINFLIMLKNILYVCLEN